MTTSAVLLSMTLALASAAPPSDRVSVDVEASDAEGRPDPTMEEQLEGELRGALSKRGLTIDGAASERHVVVQVRKLDVINYEVAVRIELDGVVQEPGVPGFACGSCRVVELYERVLEQVPQIVEVVTAEVGEPAQPEPAQGSGSGTAEPEPEGAGGNPPREGDPPRPRPRVIGPLGYSGIAVGAAGLVGVIYGGVLLVRGPVTSVDASDPRFVVQESYDRPGWIGFGVGLGAMAAGAVMVAVDVTVLRRKRAKRVTIRPALGPGLTGGTVQVRF